MHGVKKERKSCSQDFLLLTQCRKELVFKIGKSVMNRNSKITIMTLLSFFERAIFSEYSLLQISIRFHQIPDDV